MEKLLYSLSLLTYRALIGTAAFFNTKARLWVEGRKNIFKNLEKQIGLTPKKIAWFHCASLGEFEQGRPVIERFKHDFPDYKILLTFFSPSGYEIRKNYKQADYIFYLPMDSGGNARRFISIVKPNIVFFIKYEFWYHYITEIRRRDIHLVSVSAIFRENQLFFRSYGKFYADLLKSFNHIFVQNSESKSLLEKINFYEVTIAGDTRFDRVKQIAQTAAEIPIMEKFKNNHPLLVCGSTWPEDMEVLIPFINTFNYPLKLIVAPHEIEAQQIDGFINRITKPSIKFSEVSFESIRNFEVLFIDNIGMLSSLYRYGDYAYIGGGFGKGIHNILEAVVNGVSVFFGPNYKKFKEANDLVEQKAAFSVQTQEELNLAFTDLYNSKAKRENIQEITSEYIEKNTGATAKIVDYCKLVIR